VRIALALTFTCLVGCETLVGIAPKDDNGRGGKAGTGGTVGTGGTGGTPGASGDGGTAPEAGAGSSNEGGTAGSATLEAGADSGGTNGADAPNEVGDAGAGNDGDTGDSRPPPEECPREFEVPTTGAHPLNIEAGPDGNLWFTEAYKAKIGRITPQGKIDEFGPTSPSPWSLTTGPDGALWYTAANFAGRSYGWIGRISTSGEITEHLLDAVPGEITTGPDGNLWFTYAIGKVGKMTPSGQVTSYDLPSADGAPPSELVGITPGSDGNLWFVLQRGTAPRLGAIVRVTLAGEMTEYPLPIVPSTDPGFGPLCILRGPDGALWFTEGERGIGRITTSGARTEFFADMPGNYVALAFDFDEHIWVTDYNHDRIGRVAQNGVYSWRALPNESSGPNDIVRGPDGNLWFTERTGNRIGRMAPGCLK